MAAGAASGVQLGRIAQQPALWEPSSLALSFLTGPSTHFILAEAVSCLSPAPEDVSSPVLDAVSVSLEGRGTAQGVAEDPSVWGPHQGQGRGCHGEIHAWAAEINRCSH